MDAERDRIVLDTNVCLDLFVFDDPRCARLRERLHAGDVVAVTDAACRAEWLRVLGYPALALETEARDAATAHFDALMRVWPSSPAEPDAPKPPRCRDPDDQKFLDLAVRAGARWLLSRDDHLLALARRTARDGLFMIQVPDHWSL
jgi:putative PIN family toxin of toxin-antitoxin system